MSKNLVTKPHPSPVRRPASVAQIQKTTSFSGPIPPPTILEEYNRIVPGAADRILKMAEAESQFAKDITFAAIRTEADEVKRGQILGFCIGLAALATAALALHLGHPTAAGVIGGTTVVGLVSVFVVGRILESPQQTDKSKNK